MNKREKIVELLMKCCGHSRVVAELVLFIMNHDEARLVEIERALRLRQPEVSIGMRILEREGIVEHTFVSKKSKGRPEKKYKRLLSREELINLIVKRTMMRVRKMEESVRQLAEIAKVIKTVQ